ncbi:MAG: DUF456 domain-containing protein [Alistipes sp.]
MDIFLSILAFLLAIIGIIGCIVPVLPGIILTYVGLVCAYLCSYSTLDSSTLVIWFVVTVVVSAVDYLLPAYMTRRFGGSRAGAIGATVGVFIGLFGGFFGVLIGPFVGAVVGELLHNPKDINKALKVGIGSFVSFVTGTGVKLVAAAWMFILIWKDTLPPLRTWISLIF